MSGDYELPKTEPSSLERLDERLTQGLGSLAYQSLSEVKATNQVGDVLPAATLGEAEPSSSAEFERELQRFIETHSVFSYKELIAAMFGAVTIYSEEFMLLKGTLSSYDAAGRFKFKPGRIVGETPVQVVPANRSIPPEPIETTIDSGVIDRFLRTHSAFRFSTLMREAFPDRWWLSAAEFKAIDEQLQQYVEDGKLVPGDHGGRYISQICIEVSSEYDGSNPAATQPGGYYRREASLDLDTMIKNAGITARSRRSSGRRR